MSQTSLLERFKASPATWVILAANVGWFLIAETNGNTEETQTLIRYGATVRPYIWAGEYWRLCSAMFLHIGWVHLLWNSYIMFGLDTVVERMFGTWRFLIMYLLSGIGASAVSVIGQDAVSAGASGAGFGMIGVVLCLFYRRAGDISSFLADRAVQQNLMILIAWSVLGHFFGFDNYAHFGGLFFGFILGMIFTSPSLRAWPAGRIAAFAGFGLLLGAAVAGAVVPWKFLYGEEADAGPRTPQEVLEVLNRAEESGKKSYELYFSRAQIKSLLLDYDGAEEDYGRAIEMDPIRYEPHELRAELRIVRGDFEGAREDLRKVLEKTLPKWDGRARIERKLKELEEDAGKPEPVPEPKKGEGSP